MTDSTRTMILWVAVCAVVCAAAGVRPATAVVADADTTTATDPARGGSGAEDDPWLVDLDELLREGHAVVVTDEGATSMGTALLDTVHVTAPRVRVSELVRRIGEAMDEADRDMGPHGFTQLQKITMWEHRDDPAREERTEYHDVIRIHLDADGERRMTHLRGSEHKWKGGELQESELDDELEREWQNGVVENTMSMPFDLLTANRYRYTVKERNLIGDHLVLRIGFEPKSDFEAGLAGDVWIDYSDFVIRRMEGVLVGPMPAAPFLRGVPHFVLTLREEQGRWVADAFRATVVLNGSLPLVPDSVDIEVALQDYVFGQEVR